MTDYQIRTLANWIRETTTPEILEKYQKWKKEKATTQKEKSSCTTCEINTANKKISQTEL